MKSSCWVCAALGLAVACAGDPVEKPTPPDMAALVAAYDAPTADLTQDNVAGVKAAVDDLLAALEATGLDEELLEEIEAAAETQTDEDIASYEREGQIGTIRARQRIDEGFLTATRICAGWGPEPVPNQTENGQILLNANFNDEGFDPVAWGEIRNCRYRIGDSLIEVRGRDEATPGSFSVYLGEDVPFENTAQGPTIWDLDARALVDEVELSLDFDFKIDAPNDRVEARIFVDQGYVIAVAGLTLVGVRATNGDFSCDPAAGTCSNGIETVTF